MEAVPALQVSRDRRTGSRTSHEPRVLCGDYRWLGTVCMAGAHLASPSDEQPIIELVPLVRRVVAARVRDPQLVDDLVQETLVRVMAARARVEADTLAPYAAVTARNLVASVARSDSRARRVAHLLVDDDNPEHPEDGLLRHEEKAAVTAA